MKDYTKPPILSRPAPAAPLEIRWQRFLTESFAYAGVGFMIGLMIIAVAMFLG